MTKRWAEPASSAPNAEKRLCRRRLLPGFCSLRRRHRLRCTLDRAQPSGCEGIDSGALALGIIDNRDAVAARVGGKIDVVRGADAAHDVAFGMTKRHRSRCR